MGMLVILKNWGRFQHKKHDGMELSTGKIQEENLVQSAFQQTLGDKFTFQQDNNLKHKAKYMYTVHSESIQTPFTFSTFCSITALF